MSETGFSFSCATCPCYAPFPDGSKAGLCRRYPPTVHLVPQNVIGAPPTPRNLWPAVVETEKCYEHPMAHQMLATPIDSRLAETAQGEA